MAFVAHYDSGTGFIIGLYMDTMTLPSPTAPLTTPEYNNILANPSGYKINTTTFAVETRTMTDGEMLACIRCERNQKLRDSDWTMGSDVPISGGLKTSYETYRQDLRDYPADWTADHDTPWPTLPTYVKV